MIGEDAGPHGVTGGGRTARGVNGGDGREERPVPPIMAIGIVSGRVMSGVDYERKAQTNLNK